MSAEVTAGMLAVLDYEQMPQLGFFKRILRRLNRNGRVIIERKKILGAPVLYIVLKIEQDINPRALDKFLSETGRVLTAYGRVNVCFSQKFPYASFFLKNGFMQPDLTRLYETVAVRVAEKLIHNGGTAYFSAVRLSKAGADVIAALCGSCRYLLADVVSGGDECFYDIQRTRGISVVEKPAPEQFSAANAAVFMGAVRDSVVLSDDCAVFAVNGEALRGVRFKRLVTGLDIALTQAKDEEILPGFPRQAIIANALNNMTLTAGEVTLKSFTVEQTEVFRLDKARFV